MPLDPDLHSLIQNPARILQRLIQFDTTNPPGNEAACIQYIQQLLAAAGVPTRILARSAQRPNLIARLPGRGAAPALMLYGHVDVVTTENQHWRYPPFSGQEAQGYIWGRGALDMKGAVAMYLAALLRLSQDPQPPPGDIVLVVLSDEETDSNYGARFLVEEHPQVFQGLRYALSEAGGFSINLQGERLYPIQVAEKQFCSLRAILRGPAGHGSMPVHNGAVARLGRLLQLVDENHLPVHITPPVQQMVAAVAEALGGISGLLFRQLLNPALTDLLLARLGDRGRVFNPLFHNTVSPTILQASSKINVIPAEVAVELDGRLLPGFQPADLIGELRQLAGLDLELEATSFDPGPPGTDMQLFPLLADVLQGADPQGKPIPYMLSGVSDARFFARLGIQTYGYMPMQLPEDFDFAASVHAADERIPVEAPAFGAAAIYQVIQRLGSLSNP